MKEHTVWGLLPQCVLPAGSVMPTVGLHDEWTVQCFFMINGLYSVLQPFTLEQLGDVANIAYSTPPPPVLSHTHTHTVDGIQVLEMTQLSWLL